MPLWSACSPSRIILRSLKTNTLWRNETHPFTLSPNARAMRELDIDRAIIKKATGLKEEDIDKL